MKAGHRRHNRRTWCAPRQARPRVEFLEPRTLLTAFQLVADINPGSASSDAFNLTTFNGVSYFPADDGTHGDELWRSDGTAAGTYLLKDLNPGSGHSIPGNFAEAGGQLFFRASQRGDSDELWKTDGTADGTVRLLTDASTITVPKTMANLNGTLLFPATDASGTELWKSDGTAAGTVLVKDISPGAASSTPRYLTTVGGTLFFIASDGVHGDELWKSDGTAAGTVLVKDIMPGSGGAGITGLLSVGNQLIFGASDGASNAGSALWKSDGTADGTVAIKRPFTIDVTNIQQFPKNFATVGGTLYFSGSDGAAGSELWRTDGTAAGTQLVKDIVPSGSSFPRDMANVNGTLYFVAYDGIDYGVFRSDGTPGGTSLVKEGPGGGGENTFFPSMLTNVGGTLYFAASDIDHGMQLWQSDGTTAGTVRISDSFSKQLHVNEFRLSNLNGNLLFVANDGTHGSELWKIGDGTSPPPPPPNVNHAPSGADKTLPLGREQSYVFSPADFGFSDPNDNPPNAFQAVKFTAMPTGGVGLYLNGIALIPGQVVSVADIAAGRLGFTPPPFSGGNFQFSFQVQDSGGTAGGGADLDPTPNFFSPMVGFGTSLWHNATNPFDVNGDAGNTLQPDVDLLHNFLATHGPTPVPTSGPPGPPFYDVSGDGYVDSLDEVLLRALLRENHAPVGVNRILTTGKDVPYTFSVADFPITDQDTPPNSLAAVKITTLPTMGSLSVHGAPALAGQLVPVAAISAGSLVYAPAPGATGFPAATFTFQVEDNGGTAGGAIDLDPIPKTVRFNIAGTTTINHAPSGTDFNVGIIEDDSPPLTASFFGFHDADDVPPNNFLAVKITTLPASGVLALAGVPVSAGQVVPVASLQDNQLRWTPPANVYGTNYASFTFQVQDDGGTAGGGVDLDPTPNAFRITVDSANDPPSGSDRTVTTAKDTSYVFTAADFPLSDPNDNPSNSLLAVKIATLPASGTLTSNGAAVTAGQFIAASALASGSLRFTPASGATGSPYASFTFQLQDNGGVVNQGRDLDPTPNTITIIVTGEGGGTVNHAPSGADRTVSISPNAIYTLSVSDFGFSDAGDTPPNNFRAVKIATLPASGVLTLNGTAIAAGQSVSVADIVLGSLRYVPPTTNSGTASASFLFQVQDDGGVANGGVDLDPTPNTITFNVLIDGGNRNHAPSGADKAVSTLEDTAYTLRTTDFGFSDPLDSPANAFLAVKIATIPSRGILLDNNLPAIPGIIFPAVDFALGRVQFVPEANANGQAYANFTFQVQDDGGTANGGQDLDPTPNTLTFSVVSVNDAPSGIDTTRSIVACNSSGYTFVLSDFGFADPNDDPQNSMSGVRITTLPETGSLTLNGNAVTAGQLISVGDLANGRLRYAAASGGSGALGSFTFQVKDNGGTANGGQDLDSFARRFSFFGILPPIGSPVSFLAPVVNVLEDVPYTLSQADFDLPDANSATPAAVIITTPPSSGALTDNGVAVVAGQSIPAVDLAHGLLVYTPPLHTIGQAIDSIGFEIPGVGFCGTAAGGAITINVLPVNHPPSGADHAVFVRRDGTPHTFVPADFGYSDSDSPPSAMAGVMITTLPTAPYLRLDGASVQAGQFISTADLEAGKLRFGSVPHSSSGLYASFTFQVAAAGATAASVDLDPTPNTMTIIVINPWHNPVNPLDVNGDQRVTPADAALVHSYLESNKPGPVPDDAVVGAPFYDVNDDGFVTPSDELAVRSVLPNAPPGFTLQPGASVNDESGPQAVAAFARDISAGANYESQQSVHFVLSIDNSDLFAVQPAIDPSGRLTFTPAANADGQAQVTVVLQDDGGTAGGGVDTSPPQSFTISVTKLHVMHNSVRPIDVDGDGRIVAHDALDIINYLNSRGPGAAAEGESAAPRLYYDVNSDGLVTPLDAMAVINFLNSFGPEGEGESAAAAPAPKTGDPLADVITLLALDPGQQAKPRRTQ